MKRKKTDLTMKKFITFLMILTLGAVISLQASKPIPSYNAQIQKANFEENHQASANQNFGEKGRRYMMVMSQVAGPSKTPIFIWVYSLDGVDIQGPFIVYGSGEISAPIDGREWGAVVQCTDKIIVSVWTADQPYGNNQ